MIEEELAKLGRDFRTHGIGRGLIVLSDAFREGEAAGQRFDFTAPVTQAA